MRVKGNFENAKVFCERHCLPRILFVADTSQPPPALAAHYLVAGPCRGNCKRAFFNQRTTTRRNRHPHGRFFLALSHIRQRRRQSWNEEYNSGAGAASRRQKIKKMWICGAIEMCARMLGFYVPGLAEDL